MQGQGGQPEAYCHRAVLDAIGYLVDNGIKWRAMPADFPAVGPGPCVLPPLARSRPGPGVP
ncbi:transposase [Streptomyces sp. QHH-9511]|uniref:transposase n=2 Tax=Streptomyces TaxID=1883 RepID=UPI001E5F31F8|nr:transposase [Streptomyces sp. QHH-9511]